MATLAAGGRTLRIEYEWIDAERASGPLVVFLHDGLGSLAMWKDYPRQLGAAAGARGPVFSRAGYGQSTPPNIECPLLAVQGEDDEYGTMAQLEGIARRVPQAQLVKLPACGHSPHRDQPQLLTGAVVSPLREKAASSSPLAGIAG